MKNYGNKLDLGLILTIALTLLASLHLAVFQKINWDEFYYLSQIHDYGRGTFSTALQTIHVHFGLSLTTTDLNEVDQVVIGRLVMWLALVGTVTAIYVTARAFFSRSCALFAGLVYLSFNYTLVHGTSFRTDPSAAFLIMTCLAIAIRAPLGVWAILGFSVCAALSALITVKVVFYLPAFLAAILWRLSTEPRKAPVLMAILAMLAISAMLFGLGYNWHQSTLADAGLAGSKAMLSNAANTTLMPSILFPRWPYILHNTYASLAPSVIVLVGALLLLIKGKHLTGHGLAAVVVLGLALPLASFAIYRNAFPYYFPFIFPPAMILSAAVFEAAKSRVPLLAGLIVACLFTSGSSWVDRLSASKHPQAVVLDAVHEVFPEPVAYIDRNGSIARFPKAGFFMSTWGVLNYRNAGVPVLSQAINSQTIPLLLLNSPQLEHAVSPETSMTRTPLFELDREALKSNFIPHWGPIWVAGKTLMATPQAQVITLRTLGTYTLEASMPISVNGTLLGPGASITVTNAPMSIQSNVAQEITLRWGKDLVVPQTAVPQQAFFTEF
ncbi:MULTISPECIES: ArnT family glycosyltransferase [Pacificibacter]|uniref:ArnT family glycosyltransferase n=1 Tax=Pacificibacter TaxID=1042323 RepID=UPI001C09AB22|nr:MULTISPECIES: hypothetical protein [Pacificibacter]MBU2936757.1 hypothetical protein [Pacificibacter marinus]MDO6614750.1 hypothetical protein [Pacificibacter sp. 1_MG-2023]